MTYADHQKAGCPDLRGTPEKYCCHRGCKLRSADAGVERHRIKFVERNGHLDMECSCGTLYEEISTTKAAAVNDHAMDVISAKLGIEFLLE